MSVSRSHSSLLRTLVSSALVSTAYAFAIPRSVYEARQISDPSELLASYDYVIVGGGTAGLTVADRLTEDANTTVLVLESGAFPRDTVLPVVGSNTTLERTIYNSVPQPGLNGRTQQVIIGHTVGGSSAVNAMITMRGSAEDYNRWGQLFGEKDTYGWNWEGILPYFKKALTLNPPPAELAERFNITWDASNWGTDSPIQASFPAYQYPGLDPLVSAFFELPGVEKTKDSGAGGAGVYWFPTFMDPVKKQRSFAYNRHYSNGPSARPNYHLLIESPARRLILSKCHHATGVEFRKGGQTFTVNATKEVILSAGAIHTPKLLQVSGIGPKKLLESAGIKSVIDLPGVGQNFHDHGSFGAAISLPGLLNIHPNAGDLTTDASFRQWASDVWAANRTGPYSIAFGNIAGWLPMTAISPDRFSSLADEIEAQDPTAFLAEGTDPSVSAGYAAQLIGLASAMRSKDTVWSRYYVNATTGASRPILNQVFSRGSVNINTTNPLDNPPIVDYRALSNPIDVKVCVEMIKWYRRYHFETSLKGLGPNETAPGQAVQTDEELAAWLATSFSPSDYHPSGTAAMMPLELGGVVDQTLRVYKVQGLRVVDASIMPTLPGANTCQPTYAIAEKAADIIKSGKK